MCSLFLLYETGRCDGLQQWECQEQFAREPLFGRTYFRHSSPLLRGILFLSWTFFHFRFLRTEKWRFLSLKNYNGNILQQNRQKRSVSWSSYQILYCNIPFYTSFSIGNVRWILMRFYLPLPDFFIFGTNFSALFDFHENFNKHLSPQYLPTCKNSRPPILACVWILCLKIPLFALLTHAHGIPPSTSLPTTTTKVTKQEVKHSSLLSWCWVYCCFESTLNDKLMLWLFVTYRLWPVLAQLIVGFRTETLTSTCSLPCCT